MRINISPKRWAMAGEWLKVQKELESVKPADEKIRILKEFYNEANKDKKSNRYYIGASAHKLADLYRSVPNEQKAEENFNVAKDYYVESLTKCVAVINKKDRPAGDISEVQNDLVTLLPDFLRLFREHDKPWGIKKLLRLWENIRCEIGMPLPLEAVADYAKTKGNITNDTIYEALQNVVGMDPKFTRVLFRACIVGNYEIPVLILGETGTGKEIIAKTVCLFSKRTNKPFVAVNCAAIPETLIESELFGCVKGAYTGAIDRKGKFEEANGGILFLDEIAELPPKAQAGVLRAIQEGEITPVGSNEIKKVDVRLICATNEILTERIRQREFREDLFYRICGYPLHLPPLRERKVDIITIAKSHANKFAKEMLDISVVKIEDSVVNTLKDYPWPGNIRELENVMKRAIVNYDGESIKPEDIIFDKIMPIDQMSEIIPLKEMEKAYITMALHQTGGNKDQARKKLGIDYKTLLSKIKKYHIT